MTSIGKENKSRERESGGKKVEIKQRAEGGEDSKTERGDRPGGRERRETDRKTEGERAEGLGGRERETELRIHNLSLKD